MQTRKIAQIGIPNGDDLSEPPHRRAEPFGERGCSSPMFGARVVGNWLGRERFIYGSTRGSIKWDWEVRMA